MLLQEKAAQAQALLQEIGLDCWLTFVRETGVHPDPGVTLVGGTDLTWLSALIFARTGRRIAIVGRYDVSSIRSRGVFEDVIGYDQSIKEPLLRALTELNPQQIGLNYSTDDNTADGLTYGMVLLLQEILRGTAYASRLVSAGPLLAKLRARKTASEVRLIRSAVATTEEIVREVTPSVRPGLSELDLATLVHEKFRQRGLESAWDEQGCPIVNAGPLSEPGHARPRADLRIEAGQLVHMDLGVKQEGYCSDMQRMWYVLQAGEIKPPAGVQRGFDTVRRAIEAGAALLRPGARGHEIDAAARKVVVDAGYVEFMHAFGHGLGRAVHDGGTLLGPRWEKYGKTPEGIIEAGNVFTLELGVVTEAGYVGLEEDVLVTNDGCEFLSAPQTELMLVPPSRA